MTPSDWLSDRDGFNDSEASILEGNTVVSVPAVEDSLFLIMWDDASLVERRLGVMGFPRSVRAFRG